mgnify:FL=1
MGLVTPWLWAYFLGSVPLAVFYAAGLSGWFYDYPRPLFASLCLIFLMPLALLVLKVPFALLVNVIGLWAGATLLTVRIGHGLCIGGDIPSDPRHLNLLGSFIVTCFAWAVIWTLYLKTSSAVAAAFGR